jgi:hypothetical protein
VVQNKGALRSESKSIGVPEASHCFAWFGLHKGRKKEIPKQIRYRKEEIESICIPFVVDQHPEHAE